MTWDFLLLALLSKNYSSIYHCLEFAPAISTTIAMTSTDTTTTTTTTTSSSSKNNNNNNIPYVHL
jgi:hypothetical protein